MSKKKKTKQQKIIAELRHKITSQNQFNYQPSLNNESSKDQKPQEANKSFSFSTSIKTSSALKPSASISFTYHDLFKTGILTGSIIAFELILFVLLQKHILVLPISY